MEQLPERQNQKTLLVVDDDPDVLNFISKSLQAEYRVLQATAARTPSRNLATVN
jgi:CheY-like chemotaxis protein